jgi:hypothetical protein
MDYLLAKTTFFYNPAGQTGGLLLSICVLFLGQTGLASPLFYPSVEYPTVGTPYYVAIGDLNGDGALDLAVANQRPDYVSVLLNNGDGTFQAAVNYGVGDNATSLVIGDLDGDGDLDLAVATGGYVSVLLGNGDGTFQTAIGYGARGGVSIAIGDLDGDGDLDLAVADYWFDDVLVFMGNGDGTFQPAVNYGAGDGPVSVAIGDLDDDGGQDLAVANNNSDNVSVLINKGSYPIPDIKANGSDGPITISTSDTLSVTIELQAGDLSGEDCDWWVLAYTPYGWYYWHLSTYWLCGIVVTYQGPLGDVAPYEVLNYAGLPAGYYIFYFGVDAIMNGIIDVEQLYYDSVIVTITP